MNKNELKAKIKNLDVLLFLTRKYFYDDNRFVRNLMQKQYKRLKKEKLRLLNELCKYE